MIIVYNILKNIFFKANLKFFYNRVHLKKNNL